MRPFGGGAPRWVTSVGEIARSRSAVTHTDELVTTNACPPLDTLDPPSSSPFKTAGTPRNPRLEHRRPTVTGAYGKATFDTVGPLLPIGRAETDPSLVLAKLAMPGRPNYLTGSLIPPGLAASHFSNLPWSAWSAHTDRGRVLSPGWLEPRRQRRCRTPHRPPRRNCRHPSNERTFTPCRQ